MTRPLPGSAWHDAGAWHQYDVLSSGCPPRRSGGSRSRPRASPIRGPPGPSTGRAVRRLFDRVGLVQIDSVNVLSRAHYLPLFSRAGAYDTAVLDRAAHYAPRRLFEYWGHEASLIPVGLQPALRWRMERAADDAWGGMRRIQQRPAGADPRRARGGARDRPGRRQRGDGARAAEAHRAVVGLERRQARDGVAVLERAGDLGAAARLRAPLRPARAGAAAGGARGADPAGRGGAARAPARRGALARRRHRERPARLLPAARRRRRSCASPSSSRRGSCGRPRSRAGASRASSTPTRASRAGSTRARSSGRSTR